MDEESNEGFNEGWMKDSMKDKKWNKREQRKDPHHELKKKDLSKDDPIRSQNTPKSHHYS
jgi:hypothetical protein